MNIRNIFGLQRLFETQESSTDGVQQKQNSGLAGLSEDLIEQAGQPLSFFSTASSALSSDTVTIPNEDQWVDIAQPNQMSCGTTTLAMILRYYGVNLTPQQIDAVIRRAEFGAVPNDLIEFARDQGLAAEGYNNSSIAELKSFIDKGYPVQVLIDPNDTNQLSKQHYVIVTGYGTDPKTGEEYLIIHDPNGGREYTMDIETFETKWKDLWGGFNNYMIVYGPPGANLPAGRDDGIESTNVLADGGMNIVNGWDRITDPRSFGEVPHGIFQLTGGLVQGIVAGIGRYAFQVPADWLNQKVEGLPELENLIQPLGDLWNSAGAAISHLAGGIGEALDSWGEAFEDLFSGEFSGFGENLWEGVTDLAGGVADAVTDVVEGVGEAIGDFFSGW